MKPFKSVSRKTLYIAYFGMIKSLRLTENK